MLLAVLPRSALVEVVDALIREQMASAAVNDGDGLDEATELLTAVWYELATREVAS